MKRLVQEYVFNKTNKTVTFTEVFDLSQLLLITDVTNNIIIYNFADNTLGGTLVGNTLTLTYNTSALSDSDKLQIFIDEPNTDFEQLTSLVQDGLIEVVRQLQSIRNDGGMADVAGRVRVALETSATVPISITANQDLRTVATVSTVTNLAQEGGFALQHQVMSLSNQGWGNLRNKIIIS